MKALSRYVISGAVVVLIFWGERYLFPSSPASETAQLHCVFTALQQSHPVPIPNSKDRPREVDFKAGLTGKSFQDGTVLWHASGTATYEGGAQRLEGAVFLLPTNKVRGLHLYRDRYPNEAKDLRIATLNEKGILDWDEKAAFIYYEDANNKLSHRYDYRCDVKNSQNR